MKKVLLMIFALCVTLSVFSQNKQATVTMKNGTVLKGTVKEFDAMSHIVLSISGMESRIPMSEVLSIDESGTTESKAEAETKEVKVYVPVKEVEYFKELTPEERYRVHNYRGFLMEKGNNVYVYGDDNIYAQKGAYELRQMLRADGFWNVVGSLQDAHFAFKYGTKFDYRDQILLLAHPRDGDSYDILRVESVWRIEHMSKHTDFAETLYSKAILPLERKVKKHKAPYKLFKKYSR